jgi:hypothetical protein
VHSVANGNPISLQSLLLGRPAGAGAFYNPASGLGTQERVFMCGEEGGSNWLRHRARRHRRREGHRPTCCPAFNLATNGSGINASAAGRTCWPARSRRT